MPKGPGQGRSGFALLEQAATGAIAVPAFAYNLGHYGPTIRVRSVMDYFPAHAGKFALDHPMRDKYW